MASEPDQEKRDEATDPGSFLHGFFHALSDYATAEKDRLVMSGSIHAGNALARLVLVVGVLMVVSGMMLMLSVAWALLLSRWLNDPVLGFALSAATYALLGLGFFLLWKAGLRDRIILYVVNATHERP